MITYRFPREVNISSFLWLEYLELAQQFSHKNIHLQWNLNYVIDERFNYEFYNGMFRSKTVLEMKIWIHWSESNSRIYFIYLYLNKHW
jgi:hypothetical protein